MNAVLDDILPVHRHRERHEIRIAEAPETVWGAMHAVSGGDLPLTRALMGVRSLPARLAPGATPDPGAPADRGFIEAFLDRGFSALRVDPPFTWVAGAAGQRWRLRGGEAAGVGDLASFRAFTRPGSY
ncbi:MAG: hypothetical protein ACR2IP_13490 [Solirubrobacteraceae bacterium]